MNDAFNPKNLVMLGFGFGLVNCPRIVPCEMWNEVDNEFELY